MMKKKSLLIVCLLCFGAFFYTCLKPLAPHETTLELPVNASDYFFASGLMGDWQKLKVEKTAEKSLPNGVDGKVYKVDYSKADGGFYGVEFQYPANNWGARKGLLISPEAKKVVFYIAAKEVNERVSFTSGLGKTKADPDGWKTQQKFVDSMSTEWSKIEISIEQEVEDEMHFKNCFEMKSVLGFMVQPINNSEKLVFYIGGISIE